MRNEYLAFGRPDFTEVEIEAITRVMRSGWIGMGPETLAFEAELAEYLGAAHVVAVNSCTSALFLSLLVSGVGPGDEVIVPSLTWCSTANAALYLGARPVFCDVDPATFCATPESILARLTPRTRAVVPVHYGGAAIDTSALRRLLPAEVALVEDAAHALGAHYPDGRNIGSSGRLTCFSFYANKNLSTADGGAIALDDPELAERLRRLRMQGMDSHAWSRYVSPNTPATSGIAELGYKMNYTDLQAAIGRVQLARQGEMAAHRRDIALRYQERLPGLTFQTGVCAEGHARHLLVGLFEPRPGLDRDALLLALRARNIGASIHYPPLHRFPLYAAIDPVELPVTDWLARRVMTLPISAHMTLSDVDDVCDQLLDLWGGQGLG